jgi:hypothetical protein
VTANPGEITVPALGDALNRWHEFYMLLGTASATMVGLLFVAASVCSGVFTAERRAPLRVFLSASVVHFSSILTVSLIVLAPVQGWLLFGGLILACGVFGLLYSCSAWRDTLRDRQLSKVIDLEDRVWYLVLPIIGYLAELLSGFALVSQMERGCAMLALSVGILLVVGIHNAWDITVWTITRRRE